MALCSGGRLRTIGDKDGNALGYMFMCPGCEQAHAVYTTPAAAAMGKPVWSFDGNEAEPTFNPSLLVTYHRWEPPVTPENHEQFKAAPWEQKKVNHVCHSFIRGGQIQFLGDCTHKLAGATVPIPEWDKA